MKPCKKIRALPGEHELWVDIPKYLDLYQASNWGRIRSRDRFVQTKVGKNRLAVGKMLKAAPNGRTGYCSVSLSDTGNNKKTWLVHVLIALTFHGPRPSPGHVIHHIDGERTNNRYDNLEYRALDEHAIESGGQRSGAGAKVEYVNGTDTLPLFNREEK